MVVLKNKRHSISVNDKVYHDLKELGRTGDSYNTVIKRIIDNIKSVKS